MFGFVTLFAVVCCGLIMINGIVVDRLPFSDEFKESKKTSIINSALIAALVALIYCGFKFQLVNNSFCDSLFAVSWIGALANLCILAVEVVHSVHIFKLRKAGKSLDTITPDDKPAFLKFFTEFGLKKSVKEDKRTLFQRFKVIVFPCTLCVYMFLVFGVYELYFANMNEWKFNFWDILMPSVVALCIGLAFTFLLSLVLRGYNLDYCATVIATVGLMSYVQANFLPQTTFLGVSEVKTSVAEIFVNIFLWLAVIFAAIYLCKAFRKTALMIVGYAAMFLIVIQIVPVPFMIAEGIDKMSDKTYTGYSITGADQFQVSSKNNVIVLIMDTFDSKTFAELIEEEPECYDEFSDFTFYDNVSSETYCTALSMPVMLTTHNIDYSMSLIDSNAEGWNSKEAEYFYRSMQENGYKVRLYTDNDMYCGGAQNMLGKIDNTEEYQANYVSEKIPTYLGMAKLSMYRYMPHMLKVYFCVEESKEINQYTVSDNIKDALNLSEWQESSLTSLERGVCFYNNDFYNGMQNGLDVLDENSLCIFHHLYGMHEPYTTLDGTKSNKKGTLDACMTILRDYISRLKELGVYDNSTIILTADHGLHTLEGSDPVMLIKPAGVTGERLTINSAPGVLQLDLLPTILECAGIDSKPLGHSLLSMDEDMQRVRIIGELIYSSEFKKANKCSAVGYSSSNCYCEYTYVGEVQDIDFKTAECKTSQIVDYWW